MSSNLFSGHKIPWKSFLATPDPTMRAYNALLDHLLDWRRDTPPHPLSRGLCHLGLGVLGTSSSRLLITGWCINGSIRCLNWSHITECYITSPAAKGAMGTRFQKLLSKLIFTTQVLVSFYFLYESTPTPQTLPPRHLQPVVQLVWSKWSNCSPQTA